MLICNKNLCCIQLVFYSLPHSHNYTLQTGYLTHRHKPPSSTLQKTHQEHPHTATTTLDTPYKKPR